MDSRADPFYKELIVVYPNTINLRPAGSSGLNRRDDMFKCSSIGLRQAETAAEARHRVSDAPYFCSDRNSIKQLPAKSATIDGEITALDSVWWSAKDHPPDVPLYQKDEGVGVRASRRQK